MTECGAEAYEQWARQVAQAPEAKERMPEISADLAVWCALIEARIDAGLSLHDLVAQGIPASHIRRIEEGMIDVVPLRSLRLYASAVGKSLRIVPTEVSTHEVPPLSSALD